MSDTLPDPLFELTSDARRELEAYFSLNEKKPIRIDYCPTCSGRRLAMTWSEPTDHDVSATVEGITFSMDREMLEEMGGVIIDRKPRGYVISPRKADATPEADPEGGVCPL